VTEPWVYVDSSVVLAHVLTEPDEPASVFWNLPLISSRLVQFESWTVLHRRGVTETHGELLRATLGKVAMLELIRPVVETATRRTEGVLRTLDALHLASLSFLLSEDHSARLATYDKRLAKVAARAGIELYPL
jgi:predicted nucleic acid-binding protein